MASDLISRDALLDSLKETKEKVQEIYDCLVFEMEKRICGTEIASLNEAIIKVKEAPAVDAVEVVRCKDCAIYCPKSVVVNAHCTASGIETEEDDFCSLGERRKEDAD